MILTFDICILTTQSPFRILYLPKQIKMVIVYQKKGCTVRIIIKFVSKIQKIYTE